jgi:hypothetical protein
MARFIVRPIAREIASRVRESRRSPQYGHPVHQETARGTGPCRQCLSAFVVGGEDRILFTYSPFDGTSRLRQPGPVFIHAHECESHEGSGYPEGLRGIPVVAQAYLQDGTIADVRPLLKGEETSRLEALLDEPSVQFAQLRHAEAGCFIARVERLAPPA